MALRVRRWLVGVLAVFATLIVALTVYLRFATVPIRTLGEDWHHTERHASKLSDPKVHADLKWTILRAQLDHLISPTPKARRYIRPADTWPDADGHTYLRFWGGMHLAVVYCLSSRTQTLLWKTEEQYSF